jgi:predicted permease
MSAANVLSIAARDLHVALRSALREIGLTSAIVSTMTLGLTLATVGFSLVNAILIRPLSVHNPERLVILERHNSKTGESHGLNLSELDYLRARSRTTTGLSGYDYTRLNAVSRGNAELVEARLVSGNMFALLGVTAEGRALTLADDHPGAPPIAIVSCAFADRHFPRDAVSQVVQLNQLSVTIVGVLPCRFQGLAIGERPEDVWLPMSLHSQLALSDHVFVGTLGRLAPGINVEEARGELAALYLDYQRQEPGLNASDAWTIGARSGAHGIGELGAAMQVPLTLLNAAAIVVLVIACGNVTNLLLVRFTSRRYDLAVRQALGASSRRLAGELIAGVAVYAVPACAAALLLSAPAATLAADYLAPDKSAITLDLTPGPAVVLFSVLASIAVAIASALGPAFAAVSHSTGALIGAGLGRVNIDRVAARVGRWLIAGQVALSLVLLLLAGQLWRGIARLITMDPGFATAHVVSLSVYPATLGYTGARELQLYEGIRSRLASLPGVVSVGISRYPLTTDRRAPCTTGGGADVADISPRPVSPGLFATLGIHLLRGRDFSDADEMSSTPVVVLSRQAADAYFTGLDPIGRTLRLSTGAATVEPRRVIGIVNDLRAFGPRPEDVGAATCAMFVPMAQASLSDRGQASVLIRSTSTIGTASGEIRRAIAAIDPALSVMFLESAQADILSAVEPQTSAGSVAKLFASLALILACIGLYGVLSYAVSRRTREIGVRMAFGAPPFTVGAMVVRDAFRQMALGILVGGVTAVLLLPVAAHTLYGVQTVDPVVGGFCVGALLGIGLVAAWVPARRAASVDPARALRGH